MLIVVVGSTGSENVPAVSLTHPASLLRTVVERPDQLVVVLTPQHAAAPMQTQADPVTARPGALPESAALPTVQPVTLSHESEAA